MVLSISTVFLQRSYSVFLSSSVKEGHVTTSGTLLEDLEGDGRVLDGHDDAAVVQVQDVMLLLKNLQPGSDACLSSRDQRRTGHRLPVSSSAHSQSSCTSPPYTPPA